MTVTGTALETLQKALPIELKNTVMGPLWRAASASFAKGASGSATVFIGPYYTTGSTFATIEKLILSRYVILKYQRLLE